MRKIVMFALALFIGAVATAAFADVTVFVEVTKDKDKTVFEQLEKSKFADITVSGTFTPDGAAEAEALVNVLNVGNVVDQSQDAPENLINFGIERDALIEGSVNDNSGIVGVNQDVGNMVNQGNVVAVATTDSETAFADAQAAADQVNVENFSRQEEILDVDHPDRTATIADSVNNNTGIVGVNQNSGNMNNQTNAVALSVGFGSVVALAESELGQVNVGNRVVEVETHKVDVISGSINGNTGIVAVNQASGNMNNQASVVSFAAITSTVSVTTP